MKTIKWVLTAALLGGLTVGSRADDVCCKHKHVDCGPAMKKECIYEQPTTTHKKKPCYDFEKVDICIPKPRLPWQCKDEPPKCRVRTVCVPVRKDKDLCCTITKWKCKIYETCDDGCSKHKGCRADCVIVEQAPEKVPVKPKPGNPKP